MVARVLPQLEGLALTSHYMARIVQLMINARVRDTPIE
jgi:hypothetical protein